MNKKVTKARVYKSDEKENNGASTKPRAQLNRSGKVNLQPPLLPVTKQIPIVLINGDDNDSSKKTSFFPPLVPESDSLQSLDSRMHSSSSRRSTQSSHSVLTLPSITRQRNSGRNSLGTRSSRDSSIDNDTSIDSSLASEQWLSPSRSFDSNSDYETASQSNEHVKSRDQMFLLKPSNIYHDKRKRSRKSKSEENTRSTVKYFTNTPSQSTTHVRTDDSRSDDQIKMWGIQLKGGKQRKDRSKKQVKDQMTGRKVSPEKLNGKLMPFIQNKNYQNTREKIGQQRKTYIVNSLKINQIHTDQCSSDTQPFVSSPSNKNDIDWTASAEDKIKKHRRPIRSAGNLFKKTHPSTERISTMESIVNLAKSVGVICCNKTYWGTGFVIGGCYVLTALHVVREMLGLSECNILDLKQRVEEGLDKTSSRIIFNFNHDLQDKLKNFHLKSSVRYYDEMLDVILLEMIKNYGIPFPPSISSFGEIQITDTFHFIGHPNAKPKQIDIKCNLICVTKELASSLREGMSNVTGNNMELYQQFGDPYHGIEDQDRYFFNCFFEHSASGSPGVVVDNDGNGKVCTVLLGGYPVFYWDIPEENQSLIPSCLRLEYGVKMSSVYESVKQRDPLLCEIIFQKCPWK